MQATLETPVQETLRTLPSDDIRQIMWRFADRYELHMLVQGARGVARGPVARLVANGARNSHDWTADKAGSKLLSAIEPVILYQRRRFRGGQGAPGTPRYELGIQQKEDALHRLVDIWATGEASASLGFEAARLFDELDPLEKEKDRILAEKKLTGRAAFKELMKAQGEALQLLNTHPPIESSLARFARLDSIANVLCPACKLWNTGHGANMMREAVSLMGGYGVTEDCPGFLGQKWMDAQLEATYEGPEAVQRLQLSITMTNELFLVQFKQWIAEVKRVASERPGTGACALGTAMKLWLWTLQHVQTATDADGAKLYHKTRQGVTFPLADALCWLLAARQFILDVIELETKGLANPALADGLAGTVAFFTDLCHLQAARAAGEVGPWTPDFLHKHGGLVLSMGQFMQWAGAQIQSTGTVQIWPGTPVAEVLIENGAASERGQPCPRVSSGNEEKRAQRCPRSGKKVIGVRLLDQGVSKHGAPADGFTPGMDIHAALTVVGDGPVGQIGQQLDAHFGLPPDPHTRDWAVGMKFVVDLPEDTALKPGTVLHTFGYPEPEIFGFFYVHPDRVGSVGIFVPSWFDSPVRTTYRYLQHWMLHPYLWRHLKGGKLRSWGAKTLGESGRRGEPHLASDGYARIGEGSGSTNVLTGSGVDEAWATGAQLAEAVLELLKAKKPFTKANLEATYVQRRRASWVEQEARVAEKSRDGFQRGVVPGMIGMALAGLSGGRLVLPGKPLRPWERIPSLEDYFRGRIPPGEVRAIRDDCYARGVSAHGALMERAGWPAIPYDGQLLVSHQDALLLGGKVQAPPGYADHVAFVFPSQCQRCGTKLCVEVCSGQAITPGENGVPNFDREKCVHCGACLWNCASASPENPEHMAIAFRAGTGGLHSAEN